MNRVRVRIELSSILVIGKLKLFIYLAFTLVGVLLIVLTCLIQNNGIWKDVTMGLGCGLIPSGITGFLVDWSNANANQIKRCDLRIFFLRNVLDGVLRIAKVIIEESGDCNSDSKRSFIETFRTAICKIEKNKPSMFDLNAQAESAVKMLKKLSNSLNICKNGAALISDNELFLKFNDIFSEAEIGSIDYLRYECDAAASKSSISDLVDGIGEAINDLHEKVQEIKNALDQTVNYRNGKIRNWSSLHNAANHRLQD